jgi:glycosidase
MNIPANWRVLHVVTSKCPNGNPVNLGGLGRLPFDLCDPNKHDAWGPGDFDGLRLSVLPWAKLNGFNAIQISPVIRQVLGTTWQGNIYSPNHAYHPFRLYESSDAIETEPHFGTRDELKNFISSAHSIGIKVIADIVPNHRGYESPDTQSHPEFFHCEADMVAASRIQDWLRLHEVTPMAGLPDLRHSSFEVRRRLDQEWLFHLEMGFDAFRVDALMHCDATYREYLRKFSPFAGMPITNGGYPIFGENYAGNVFADDEGHPENGHTAMWSAGFGSTGHPWHFAVQEEFSLSGHRADVSRIAQTQSTLVAQNAQCVGFVDNHDTDRCMTACLENGNSEVAASERVHAMLVALYGFVSPPAVLYGTDELAQGFGVRAMARGIATSNRVIWTPPSSTPTLTLLRALNHARATYASLEQGDYSERYVSSESGVFSYIRFLANNPSVLFVANLWDFSVNAETLTGSIQIGDHFGDSASLLDLTGLASGSFSVVNGRLHGALPPRSAYLLSAV